MPPKRVKYDDAAIQSQLSSLYLSEFSAASDSLVQLAPVLRNINASKQQDAYLRHLKDFISSKEREIEEVCKANYQVSLDSGCPQDRLIALGEQDFVSSTDKLLKVRQGTVSLKHRVVELNEDIQAKGGELSSKVRATFIECTKSSCLLQKRNLLDNRRVGQNIDETIDSLQACLRVLDLAAKIGQLIETKKYYSALRSLDNLEHSQLKNVIHLPFASHMLHTLPATRHHIRTEVMKDMKTWLFTAREASRTVGASAHEAMEQRTRRWKARRAKDVDGSLRVAKINGAVEMAVSERHEYNVLESEQIAFDFKPLYQCILIHDTLDLREELQLSYAEDRRAQAALLLSSTSLNPLTMKSLTSLLEEVVGFFIIEAHVLKNTRSFRQDTEVDDLWDGMREKAIASIADGLKACKDPEIYLAAQMQLVIFAHTMEVSQTFKLKHT